MAVLQGKELLGVLAVYAVTQDRKHLLQLQSQAQGASIEIMFLNGHPMLENGQSMPFFRHSKKPTHVNAPVASCGELGK